MLIRSLARACLLIQLAACSVGIWLAGLTSSVAGERPNLIVVVADDMGYRDASCYGCEDFLTPHNGERMISLRLAPA